MLAAGRLRLAVLGVIGFAGLVDTAFLLGVISGYAMELGADSAFAGLIAGLYSMAAIPASVLAGFVVDRWGRRRSLSLGLAWDSIAMWLYAVVSTPLQLAVLRVLHALGGSLVYPALFAYIGDVAGPRRGRYSGVTLAAIAGAVAAGNILAHVLVAEMGFRKPLAIVALIVLAGFLLSLGLEEPPRQYRPRARGGGSLDGDARLRAVLASLIMFLLYLGFGVITGGLTQAQLEEGLAGSEEEASSYTALAIATATMVSIPVFIIAGSGIDRGHARLLAAVSALAAVATLVETARVGGSRELAAAYAPYGVAIGVLMTASTVLAISVPAEYRGRSVAVQQVANILGVAFGAPLGGVIASWGLAAHSTAATIPVVLASLVMAAAAGLLGTRARRG